MAFGWPARYIHLDIEKVQGGNSVWDESIEKATAEYSKKCHKFLWDNCYTFCGMALNSMNYDGSNQWSMLKLAILMTFKGSYAGVLGKIKTWLPVAIVWGIFLGVLVKSWVD